MKINYLQTCDLKKKNQNNLIARKQCYTLSYIIITTLTDFWSRSVVYILDLTTKRYTLGFWSLFVFIYDILYILNIITIPYRLTGLMTKTVLTVSTMEILLKRTLKVFPSKKRYWKEKEPLRLVTF